jgi:hypothetical protein
MLIADKGHDGPPNIPGKSNRKQRYCFSGN